MGESLCRMEGFRVLPAEPLRLDVQRAARCVTSRLCRSTQRSFSHIYGFNCNCNYNCSRLRTPARRRCIIDGPPSISQGGCLFATLASSGCVAGRGSCRWTRGRWAGTARAKPRRSDFVTWITARFRGGPRTVESGVRPRNGSHRRMERGGHGGLFGRTRSRFRGCLSRRRNLNGNRTCNCARLSQGKRHQRLRG